MANHVRVSLLILAMLWGGPFSWVSRAHATSGPASFADLADKVLPAVVNISTSQTFANTTPNAPSGHDGPSNEPDLQLPPGAPFDDLLRDFFGQRDFSGRHPSHPGSPRTHRATSLGSGFVIDPTGYIVTNEHVIQNADTIDVVFANDVTLPAKIVGRDEKTDLALLKVVPAKPLPFVPWGDSDKARVGDWIVAVGNPFGLGGSVTAGIISARARDINSGPYDDYLQTDAPINRGNSGGPMFNMDGEVVGVNSAIFSPSGGSIGIGFAIPSALAKGVIAQLKDHGKTRRGWLGVHVQTVTPEIADSLGLGKPHGALVSSLTAGSPATEAHLLAGDVILTFDGKEVSEMHRLPRLVAEAPIGQTVPVVVWRRGKQVTVSARIAELKDDESVLATKDAGAEDSASHGATGEVVRDLGVTVAPVTAALRRQYNLGQNASGLVVTRVESTGSAAQAGLQTGDVLSEVNQQELHTAKDLTEETRRAQKADKPLLVLVDRAGDLRFVAIPLKEVKK